MIIFGSNSVRVFKEIITEPCPHCNNVNCVEMNVLQKYAHIFWIPFFPIGKTGMSICGHCKKVMKLPEMPEIYKMAYSNAKLQSGTPLWTFAGLVLATVLISWLTYEINENDKLNAKLISAPQKEDIYKVKTEDDRYMLYRVSDVRGDTVFVQYSQTHTGRSKNTKYILRRGADAFFAEQNPILKTDLKKMMDDGNIIAVQRGIN